MPANLCFQEIPQPRPGATLKLCSMTGCTIGSIQLSPAGGLFDSIPTR